MVCSNFYFLASEGAKQNGLYACSKCHKISKGQSRPSFEQTMMGQKLYSKPQDYLPFGTCR